jgi:MoaA/NifB/PqqE/SkfB family radical SAM enzyme
MYLSRRLNRSLAPPDRVSLNLTLRCNLSCSMCTTCYDAPELSLEAVKDIIDQTAAWGVEVFNPLGGEPFMRGDVEEILAYAVRRGFYVTVTTNGTLITEGRAQAIAAIPSDRLHFNFSLDGRQAAHDEIRSEGMWQRAIQGYRRIRTADAAAGNSRRKILSNTILHARNLDDFEAVLDEQAELGFDGVQILNLFRQGEEVPPEAANLWLQDVHMDRLGLLTAALARRAESQGPVGFRIQNTPDQLRRIPAYYRDALTPLDAPCWAGWKELYINADGQAIMCDGKLDFIKGGFGRVQDQSLQQLWQSPALKARREVVKQCTTPCVQSCYLREESDSAAGLAGEAGRKLALRLKGRLQRLRPVAAHHPEATLRLELSDVCPCDWDGCSTPPRRWSQLIAQTIDPPSAETWTVLRDGGVVDFGRGFMGFEVLQQIVQDLQTARLRFGTLALRWRGEPLLHPEAERILRTLLDTVAAGRVADRLCIETDGRFLSGALAALAAHPAPQTWVLDLDRGGPAAEAALAALQQHQGPATQLILARTAGPGVDVCALAGAHPELSPVAGRRPAHGDSLWIRRSDHPHFQANAEARAQLQAAADSLGLSVDLGEESQPRLCRAPERSPTISWDGKLALCPVDIQLQQIVGDVISQPLSVAWTDRLYTSARRACASGGTPGLGLCADCSMPWSPNHD